MPEPTDIHALLARGGRDDIAVAAPEREPLTYGGLRDQVGRTGDALGRAGIGPGDGVAIVLPNGPEMAAAFLGTAAYATAAPLNPAYRVDEFAFYLEDLRAKALILEAGTESPAIEAAQRVGVPIIGLTPEPSAGAGCFSLDIPAGAGDARANGEADDAALVLHTSGTTSRPKIVPLTGANLCASARNIADWISLEPGERCLNIMPLFHIHGLMAGVMASLHAGSTVICTPGFNALLRLADALAEGDNQRVRLFRRKRQVRIRPAQGRRAGRHRPRARSRWRGARSLACGAAAIAPPARARGGALSRARAPSRPSSI